MQPIKRDRGGYRHSLFFEHFATAPPHFRDETIAHYGAATELVLEYGWPPGQVVSEPFGDSITGVGMLTNGALDLLVLKTLGGKPFMGVEAKGDPRKLGHLMDKMNVCEGQVFPGHGRSLHKKCEALNFYGLDLFWGVACQSTRELMRVERHGNFVRLTPEPDDTFLRASDTP